MRNKECLFIKNFKIPYLGKEQNAWLNNLYPIFHGLFVLSIHYISYFIYLFLSDRMGRNCSSLKSFKFFFMLSASDLKTLKQDFILGGSHQHSHFASWDCRTYNHLFYFVYSCITSHLAIGNRMSAASASLWSYPPPMRTYHAG